MSVPRATSPSPLLADERLPWILVAVGLAAMFGPTFVELWQTVWNTEQQGQGPIVLVLACWLIWRERAGLAAVDNARPRTVLGWALLVFACLAYAFGRSQGILMMETGSLIPALMGIVLLLRGAAHLRLIWFALFFLLFLMPLPGPLVDALTQPMKLAVSVVADQVLYSLGYPISRTGVTIEIGPYQLLVADACAGLHTLFTLEALGLLYLNVVRHSSMFRNIALGILIIPISFTANVIRVIIISLVTFYFGDEAGQSFIHGLAGMVLFLTALMLIIAVDSGLRFGARRLEEA